MGSLPKYLFIKQFNWEFHFFCISLYVFLFFSDTSEWTEVLLLRKMVKVISVHHFLSQDVTAIPGPTAVTLAGQNILLMATENLQVEVRDLKAAGKCSHTFPTIGNENFIFSNFPKRNQALIEAVKLQ